MLRKMIILISIVMLLSPVVHAAPPPQAAVEVFNLEGGTWQAYMLRILTSGVGIDTARDLTGEAAIDFTLEVGSKAQELSVTGIFENLTDPVVLARTAPNYYMGATSIVEDTGTFKITTTYRLDFIVTAPDRIEMFGTLGGYEGGWTQQGILVPDGAPDPRPELRTIDCPGALLPYMEIGSEGYVHDTFNGGDRLFSKPSLKGDIITNIMDSFVVLDGPVCAESRLWWQVDVAGQTGWLVEGADGNYFMLPLRQLICSGGPTPRLMPGEYASVLPGDPNNVRDEPFSGAAIVGSIPGGAAFLVLDGPVCVDGFAWWLVSYESITGWTAEGQGTTYWLRPDSD